MNETLYIYYIIPDTNFVNEKETKEYSENLQSGFEKLLSGITGYFPLILLILLLIYVFRQMSK